MRQLQSGLFLRLRISCGGPVRAKDEVDSGYDAQSGPEKIQPRLLLHVNDRKGNEHHQRYRFLKDLQLAE